MPRVKKFLFPGTALIISLYISGLFAIGIIIGYLGTILFHKKLVDTGRVRLMMFGLGKWKIHFHHWLIGALIFLSLWFGDLLQFFPKIYLGMLGGLIFHDIYLDKNWYKVVLRK